MRKNIPFIHNYCNRWCERCPFTESCAVFESEMEDTDDEKDISNDSFWAKLSKNFEGVIKMIHEQAQEMGIDLNNIPEEKIKAMDAERESQRKAAKEDPLIDLCKRYHDLARKVLHDETLWTKIAEEMIAHDEMGIVPREELNERLELLKDSKAIICWHMAFIQVKFMRAITGSLRRLDFEYDPQTDANGSAKVAMIAVADSQNAWLRLSACINEEDMILPVLGVLSAIDKMAKEKFPRAMEFVRPGFDEVEKVEIEG